MTSISATTVNPYPSSAPKVSIRGAEEEKAASPVASTDSSEDKDKKLEVDTSGANIAGAGGSSGSSDVIEQLKKQIEQTEKLLAEQQAQLARVQKAAPMRSKSSGNHGDPDSDHGDPSHIADPAGRAVAGDDCFDRYPCLTSLPSGRAFASKPAPTVDLRRTQILCPPGNACGSGLAREGVGTARPKSSQTKGPGVLTPGPFAFQPNDQAALASGWLRNGSVH